MKVTLGIFTDGEQEWTSLIIDSIGVAQKAVKDIIGAKLSEIQLNDHAIYDREWDFVNLNTGKDVFKDICSKMYKKQKVVMNINGGYYTLKDLEWTQIRTKVFEFHSSCNILNLLKEQNNKKDIFKLIENE